MGLEVALLKGCYKSNFENTSMTIRIKLKPPLDRGSGPTRSNTIIFHAVLYTLVLLFCFSKP